ncbi:MAG: RidA family protein [Pararhodobacter sp.]|nr:RidA family protein [Pararhodobacter sp.]
MPDPQDEKPAHSPASHGAATSGQAASGSVAEPPAEKRALAPDAIAPPFGAYSHGVLMPPGMRMIRTSGQLALSADGKVPKGAEAQAALCFDNIARILAAGGMTPAHIVHLTAWVTAREHMCGYMRARDAFLSNVPVLPASTLLVVSGFSWPEFVIEIEAMAFAP